MLRSIIVTVFATLIASGHASPTKRTPNGRDLIHTLNLANGYVAFAQNIENPLEYGFGKANTDLEAQELALQMCGDEARCEVQASVQNMCLTHCLAEDESTGDCLEMDYECSEGIVLKDMSSGTEIDRNDRVRRQPNYGYPIDLQRLQEFYCLINRNRGDHNVCAMDV